MKSWNYYKWHPSWSRFIIQIVPNIVETVFISKKRGNCLSRLRVKLFLVKNRAWIYSVFYVICIAMEFQDAF